MVRYLRKALAVIGTSPFKALNDHYAPDAELAPTSGEVAEAAWSNMFWNQMYMGLWLAERQRFEDAVQAFEDAGGTVPPRELTIDEQAEETKVARQEGRKPLISFQDRFWDVATREARPGVPTQADLVQQGREDHGAIARAYEDTQTRASWIQRNLVGLPVEFGAAILGDPVGTTASFLGGEVLMAARILGKLGPALSQMGRVGAGATRVAVRAGSEATFGAAYGAFANELAVPAQQRVGVTPVPTLEAAAFGAGLGFVLGGVVGGGIETVGRIRAGLRERFDNARVSSGRVMTAEVQKATGLSGASAQAVAEKINEVEALIRAGASGTEIQAASRRAADELALAERQAEGRQADTVAQASPETRAAAEATPEPTRPVETPAAGPDGPPDKRLEALVAELRTLKKALSEWNSGLTKDTYTALKDAGYDALKLTRNQARARVAELEGTLSRDLTPAQHQELLDAGQPLPREEGLVEKAATELEATQAREAPASPVVPPDEPGRATREQAAAGALDQRARAAEPGATTMGPDGGDANMKLARQRRQNDLRAAEIVKECVLGGATATVATSAGAAAGQAAGRQAATPASDPPVPAGHVRFYHGGDNPGSGGGRWLTPYRDYAEGYAKGGLVSYVDIPESSPLLKKTFDDTGTSQKASYVHFEAPEELARQLKPVAGAPAGGPSSTTDAYKDWSAETQPPRGWEEAGGSPEEEALRNVQRETLAREIKQMLTPLFGQDQPNLMFWDQPYLTLPGHAGSHSTSFITNRSLIELALDAPFDIKHVAYHEAWHALGPRGMDKISPDEYAMLQKAADDAWIEWAGIEERYSRGNHPELSEAGHRNLMREEAIAEAHAAWQRGQDVFSNLPDLNPEQKTKIVRAFEYVSAFFRELRRQLFGARPAPTLYKTPEELFAAIRSGEIGKRDRNLGKALGGPSARGLYEIPDETPNA